jgi:hypothetical protein
LGGREKGKFAFYVKNHNSQCCTCDSQKLLINSNSCREQCLTVIIFRLKIRNGAFRSSGAGRDIQLLRCNNNNDIARQVHVIYCTGRTAGMPPLPTRLYPCSSARTLLEIGDKKKALTRNRTCISGPCTGVPRAFARVF